MSRANILLEAESFSTVEESQVSEETKKKSNTENGVYVKGMALPFGKPSRNGVQYEKNSVEEAHDDLEGRPMLFNHKQDWVSGHILNTEITDDGMYFEGDINPNAEMPNGVTVAEAIDRGDINSVSIQAFVEQTGEPADEDAIIDDMETEKVMVRDFLEISAVTIPGFPDAEALPEHLQHQGVKPVTELAGSQPVERNTEENEQEESQDESQEDITKEQYEFAPVPTHVLYDSEEDALQRARNLGLDDIHEHEMSGQIYYMAGDNHNEWLEAIDRENPTDNEDVKGEPFAGYDDFEQCVMDNQDKQDPEAYCGEIKDKAEELNDAMGEDTTQEQEDTETEQVSEENFEEFVANHMEGADAADVTEALAEYNFTGLDQGEVAKLLANEFELDQSTVMDVIGELEDMESPEEAGNDNPDEDDDEEEQTEEGNEETEEEDVEDKEREELEEQVKEQSEKIDQLEERLETILENDEGSSKQDAPSAEEESTIERRPSFKGLT